MRTVLIGGASSDIGLETCRRYLAHNWRVIAHFRTARSELSALTGPLLETWHADFSDIANLERELRDRLDYFSKIDAFVSLAAEITPCTFEQASAASILSALSINVLPGLLIMRAVSAGMIGRKWGRIVHASSIGTRFGGGFESFPYALSKHAQEFIPVATRRWSAANVFVNVVRVGVTDTRAHAQFVSKKMSERVELIPARRMARPEEIAETLYWLGSENNGFISGQVVNSAGGE